MIESGFFKTFEIRWEDLDVNRHLANRAISSLMIETRMAFLKENGLGYTYFQSENIGPAILNEHFYYLKEVLPDEKVTISLELRGLSEDGRFNRWGQALYNSKGHQCVFHEVNFVWFDLAMRKMVPPTGEIRSAIDKMFKSDGFEILPARAFLPPADVPTGLKLDLNLI